MPRANVAHANLEDASASSSARTKCVKRSHAWAKVSPNVVAVALVSGALLRTAAAAS